MVIPSEKELLSSACHIGHRAAKWNPKMAPYLYSVEQGVHLFDLVQTREGLRKVCEALSEIVREGKTLLLVSTKPQCAELLAEIAKKTGFPIVSQRWFPGLLTNWRVIGKRIQKYLDLQRSFQTGEVEKYTKKEQLKLRKQLAKLDHAFAGVAKMGRIPDAVLVTDALQNRIAVLEANTVGIPVYGICDSNANPDLFTAFIPANDSAKASLEIVLRTIDATLQEAQTERAQKAQKAEEQTQNTPPSLVAA